MLIKAMTVRNFKAIGDKPVRIEFRPLTLLFGPNSAGKSSILHALQYASALFCDNDPDPTLTGPGPGRGTVDLGGFANMLHRRDSQHSIHLRFDLEPSSGGAAVTELASRFLSDGDSGLFSEDLVPPLPNDAEYPSHRKAFIGFFSGHVTSAWIEVAITMPEHLGSLSPSPPAGLEPNAETLPYVSQIEIGLNNNLFARLSRLSPTIGTPSDLFLNLDHPLAREEHEFSLSSYELAEAPTPVPTTLREWFRERTTAESLLRVETFGWHDPGLDTLRGGRVVFIAPRPPEWFTRGNGTLGGEGTGHRHYVCHERILYQLVGTAFSAMILFVSGALAKRFFYLGPLRGVPPRSYASGRVRAQIEAAEGMETWQRLLESTSDDDMGALNETLSAQLHLGYSIKMQRFRQLDFVQFAAIRQALLPDPTANDVTAQADPAVLLRALDAAAESRKLAFVNDATGLEFHPLDLGTGVSQVVPVAVMASCAPAGSLVAIEQPELHLHPALQVNLGDVFLKRIAVNMPPPEVTADSDDDATPVRALVARFALYLERRHQGFALSDSLPTYLLETHSEHLILRILRRIRETTEGTLPAGAPACRPRDVAVYFVEQQDGALKATELPISGDGEFLVRWPHGFFEEREEELF